ncbi:MAG: hypothetical protein ACP5XB_16515 [Isosphaeraceae bacterium]
MSANNTQVQDSVYEGVPGSFTVRCKIVYQSVPGPGGKPYTPPPETPTTSVSVSKPDGVAVYAGDRVSVYIGQSIPIWFTVFCQGQPVGYLGGYPQERLEHICNQPGEKEILKDSGWGPPFGKPSNRFELSQNMILDMKKRGAVGWQLHAVGVVRTAKQSLRLVFWDPCGNEIDCPLSPSFTVGTVKESDTLYHYEHDPNSN